MQTTTQHTEDELLETLSPKIRNRLHNLLQEDYVSEQQAEEVKEFILELGAVSQYHAEVDRYDLDIDEGVTDLMAEDDSTYGDFDNLQV
ncbi:MAG: hypothetical protein ABEJ03_06200 [Candidatus Nanohaloarchaea archaeon]